MRHRRPTQRILAINPSSKGFGYAVLEDHLFLVDWGIVVCNRRRKKPVSRRQKNQAACIDRAKELIEEYHPTKIVIEDCRHDSSHRCHDVQVFLSHILFAARKKNVPVQFVAPKTVHHAFARFGARNKEQIAEVVSEQFPELLPLPKHRDPWMSETYRMGIFDAVALCLSAMLLIP
ncbi:MAG: crossover junction endodeoxyribonuclease RuvC [Elusimicrobia bacterium]|nr:crossover junction endodeoxyribonuclease RuvC [Elusimicrobiota bacterium]